MQPASDAQRQWTGGQLLGCALIQLVLVHISFRIDRQKTAPLVSTSSWAIFFGIGFGALLAFVSRDRANESGLDPELLFFGLLPPIMLEAGFSTQRKGFFSNFAAILLLAILGTVVATLVTGGILVWLGSLGMITRLTDAEALLYGALISAIDPISTLLVMRKSKAPPLLFNLLFGESVLNDAVAIVLFSLCQQFALKENPHFTVGVGIDMLMELLAIGVGSVILAAIVCYSSAFLLKKSNKALKQYPTYEISIILLSAYASYVAGEFFQLSGILAVFFSGVLIRHYHMYNISKSSAAAFHHLLATLAFLAENFIYIYLGISLVAFADSFRWDWGFILASFAACLIARACNTFPLCWAANTQRKNSIPFSYMVVIWFAGLRGAIAFALAQNVKSSSAEHTAIIQTATLFTVLFSTVFFSMGTAPLLKSFELTGRAERARSFRTDEGAPLIQDGYIREMWVQVDEKHLKPVFGGRPRKGEEYGTLLQQMEQAVPLSQH